MPEFESTSARLASFANRAAINTIVQGGSSDIIKKAMIDIYAAPMPKGVRMLLQVHDELIVEAPQDESMRVALIVQEEMENAVKMSVPLTADAAIGRTWYDAKG